MSTNEGVVKISKHLDMVEDEYNDLNEDKHQTVAQMTALKKTLERDRSTLYFLYNTVDESRFERIANVTSAKEV